VKDQAEVSARRVMGAKIGRRTAVLWEIADCGSLRLLDRQWLHLHRMEAERANTGSFGESYRGKGRQMRLRHAAIRKEFSSAESCAKDRKTRNEIARAKLFCKIDDPSIRVWRRDSRPWDLKLVLEIVKVKRRSFHLVVNGGE